MILDTLDNLKNYPQVSTLMQKVLDFIDSNRLEELEPGRVGIQGDDLFVNVNVQPAQTREEARIEAHRDYIDIQIPLSRDEEMGFVSGQFLSDASVPYDVTGDVAFYPGLCDTYLQVRKGMFVIFFPGEGHAPAIVPDEIKKIIVKIRKGC